MPGGTQAREIANWAGPIMPLPVWGRIQWCPGIVEFQAQKGNLVLPEERERAIDPAAVLPDTTRFHTEAFEIPALARKWNSFGIYKGEINLSVKPRDSRSGRAKMKFFFFFFWCIRKV